MDGAARRMEIGRGVPPPLKFAKQFLVVELSTPARRGRGAPKGNRNAVTHGAYAAPSRARRAEIRAMVERAEALIVRAGMVTSSLKKLAGVGGMLGSEASPHEIASGRLYGVRNPSSR